jgi:two-component system, OmpR family, aerobic respiration control protein ArcA
VKNKIKVKDLVERIATLARERISSAEVVSLNDLKKINTLPPTVLIIEDDESLRKAMIRLLESKRYRVLAAGNAIELLNVIYDTAIDLIILDVGLPWIDGYEIARMMKENAELRRVPLVFISGADDKDAMKKGFQVGAHDFISKPFQIEEMGKTVDTLLELHDVIHPHP